MNNSSPLCSTIAPAKHRYTEPDDAPPATCLECGTPVNPVAYLRLTDTGPWFLAEPCAQCERAKEADAAAKLRAEHLAHYCDTVPASYRSIADGGTTDLAHPHWAERKGPTQLAFLRAWKPEERPWAGIIGPAGQLKSRVLGLFARELALRGSRLLWLNGASLSWCTTTQRDFSLRTKANHHLHNYRTHRGTLLLDDLWKAKPGADYFSDLYALLEHRSAHRLPLLWTANTHPNDPAIRNQIPQDMRDPIIGRLLENTHLAEMSNR